MRNVRTKWLGIAAALALMACGGAVSESTAAASSHDVFEGVWQVTSSATKAPQEFRFVRAYDGTVRAGGWVFYPTDADLSYVGAENLSLDGSAVTGHALISITLDREFTVPISVTFDGAHLTGMLGSLQLDGSR